MAATSRGTDGWLARLQALSGAVLGAFLSVHLAGHLTAHVGLATAHGYLTAARAWYQAPWAELGVLPTALAVHVVVGLVRMVRRSNEAAARKAKQPPASRRDRADRADKDKADRDAPADWRVNPWASPAAVTTWQRRTGLVLTGLIVVHSYATRVAPVLFLADPSIVDYTVVTASLRLQSYLFYPYYFVLGGAGAYHLIHGVGAALSVLWPGASASARATSGRALPWRAASAVAFVALASAVLALGGVYYPIAIPHAKALLDLQWRASLGLVDERHLADAIAH